MSQIVFITGTDTGVGKTFLACLLVSHLRQQGLDAVALKPFCSGSRSDIRRLRRAQMRALTEDQICPFYFPQPVTPMIAARKSRRRVTLSRAVHVVQTVAARHPWVLVEGAGGLLAPLGENWSAREWIQELRAKVLVVAADRLGTLNHTRLTLEALHNGKCGPIRLVLNGTGRGDPSTGSNEGVLRAMFPSEWAGRLPWRGSQPFALQVLEESAKKLKKILARALT